MKRLLSIVALAAALTLGTGGNAFAHELYVTTPEGEPVLVNHDLAKGTPRIFDGDSAASQGTNTACLAVPASGTVLIAANNNICPPVP